MLITTSSASLYKVLGLLLLINLLWSCGFVPGFTLWNTYIVIWTISLSASTSFLATVALTASVAVLLLFGGFFGTTLTDLSDKSLLLWAELFQLFSLGSAQGQLSKALNVFKELDHIGDLNSINKFANLLDHQACDRGGMQLAFR